MCGKVTGREPQVWELALSCRRSALLLVGLPSYPQSSSPRCGRCCRHCGAGARVLGRSQGLRASCVSGLPPPTKAGSALSAQPIICRGTRSWPVQMSPVPQTKPGPIFPVNAGLSDSHPSPRAGSADSAGLLGTAPLHTFSRLLHEA